VVGVGSDQVSASEYDAVEGVFGRLMNLSAWLARSTRDLLNILPFPGRASVKEALRRLATGESRSIWRGPTASIRLRLGGCKASLLRTRGRCVAGHSRALVSQNACGLPACGVRQNALTGFPEFENEIGECPTRVR
jgi:hypothetical protein